MDRSSRHKINVEIMDSKLHFRSNGSKKHIKNILSNSSRIFFSNEQKTFSSIDHMLDHKTNLHNLNKIGIILNNFSDHNR